MLYRQILIFFYDFSIFLLLPLNNSSLLKWVNLNDRFNLPKKSSKIKGCSHKEVCKLKRSFQFTHYTTKKNNFPKLRCKGTTYFSNMQTK